MTTQKKKQRVVYKTLVFDENVGKAQDPNKKLQLPFELEDTYKILPFLFLIMDFKIYCVKTV